MRKRASNGRSGKQKPIERDVIPEGVDVPDRDLFFNRELSWLAFNDRVLQLAEDASVPLLERLKFCAIYARNLDEFFMIRVARLHEQHRGGFSRLVPDGATPGETLDKLHAGIRDVARVKVPKELLPRFVPLKGRAAAFVPLEDIIAHNLGALFPGMEVLDYGVFRVTRDADFTVSEDAEDLLVAVQDELRQRRFGDVIRLELQPGMNPKLREPLMEALGLEPRQVYEDHWLLALTDLHAVVSTPGFAELRVPPWTPVTQPRLRLEEDAEGTVMAAMRRGDLLVHHPYESFATSVERFVAEAVEDPDVLAIKQTVYRTSDSSPLVPALIRATEGGKQAVCMVELKARFDERTNIQWALALEEAGVHVVYGIPGLKTHAKAILVVHREGERRSSTCAGSAVCGQQCRGSRRTSRWYHWPSPALAAHIFLMRSARS
jgi:polyphosphate kinase